MTERIPYGYKPGETLEDMATDLWQYLRTMTPPQFVAAFIAGLKAAGASGVRTAWFPHLKIGLPKVVEFDCPFWHDGEIPGTYGKVRMLVGRQFGIYEGLSLDGDSIKFGTGSCPGCINSVLFAWLATCPRCEANEGYDTHPKHHQWDYRYEALDESPFNFVMQALALGPKPEATQVEDWTTEKALDWLKRQEGIPATASQREAWRLAKEIPGHPPQRFVQPAQGMREG